MKGLQGRLGATSGRSLFRWRIPHQSRNMFILQDITIGMVTLFIVMDRMIDAASVGTP
jgi:hypothetical protein